VRRTKEHDKFGQLLCLYRCLCGNEVLLKPYLVNTRATKSCGCLKHDRATIHILGLAGAGNRAAARSLVKHGMSKTRFYFAYKAMMNRCYRPSVKGYESYGGRGIAVDERWHRFENFRDDMYESYLEHHKQHGSSKRNTSIERMNNELGYSKSNCCWATVREQALNRRPRKLGLKYSKRNKVIR